MKIAGGRVSLVAIQREVLLLDFSLAGRASLLNLNLTAHTPLDRLVDYG